MSILDERHPILKANKCLHGVLKSPVIIIIVHVGVQLVGNMRHNLVGWM